MVRRKGRASAPVRLIGGDQAQNQLNRWVSCFAGLYSAAWLAAAAVAQRGGSADYGVRQFLLAELAANVKMSRPLLDLGR